MITAAGLGPLEPFMRAHGLDWRRHLESVGIDPALANDPDAMVPMQAGFALLENVARESGNDAFGLLFAEFLPTRLTGALAYLTWNAPDLRAYCRDTARFVSLVADAYTVRFEEGPAWSYLTFEIPPVFGPRAQFLGLAVGVTALRLRQLTGAADLPLHIGFEHPAPRKAEEFHRVLGRNVHFDCQENRIGIETRHLSRPLPASDPELYRIVRRHAQSLLSEREKETDISMRLTDYITEALKTGEATLTGAAESLGLSPRALQRQLEATGTSFRDLVESTRRGLARHFILDTSIRLTEIAFLLGFSELSAFSRWTRGWTGKSPSELRRSKSDHMINTE